jgi:hypothetical protein
VSEAPVLTLQQEREMRYHEAAIAVEEARKALDEAKDSSVEKNNAAREAYLKAVTAYHRTRIY